MSIRNRRFPILEYFEIEMAINFQSPGPYTESNTLKDTSKALSIDKRPTIFVRVILSRF